MNNRAFPIPSWAPAAAAAAIVLWAANIWWMVATLPTGGDTSTIEAGLTMIADELEDADARLEALSAQVVNLETERDALTARVEELESKPAHTSALELSLTETEDGAATGAAEEPDAEAGPEASRFFTNGADRFNCRDFTSHAEAEEALRVNGPGDPNRIDMNGNGQACEDFRYPAPASSTPAAVPAAP